jgi:hypothetical protein
MKAYWGVELQLQTFFISALVGGEWPASRPGRFTQGKSPWYLLYRSLGGPQSRYGCGGDEKTSQPLPGREPATIQPVS